MKVPQCQPVFPNIDEKLWCNVCDNAVVRATEPDSGTFFITPGGHRFGGPEKVSESEYGCMLFSVCTKCLNCDDE